MMKLRTYCIVLLLCVAAVNDSPAQNGSFSTPVNFDVSNGAFPYATFVDFPRDAARD